MRYPGVVLAGEKGWRGVNQRVDPALLEDGWCSQAINLRFRSGIPETRFGSMLAPWLLNLVGTNIQPWTTVYGHGEFKDPTTFTEYVLIAADGLVYICLQNNAPRILPLPAGETITERCTFLQAFNVVLLLRGFNADPLVMDDVNVGFKPIVATPLDDEVGELTIPRALRGVFAANRVFLLREDDTMVASDVLDYTRYSILDDFRVNQGDADKGVAIGVFGSSTILVFKERSVYRVDNIFGDLSQITFSLVTRRYGCVAADTVVDCGSDMLWLSQEGVASLTLTIQNEIQSAQGALAGKNRMFSEDIGPIIDRIHGSYISGAYAALWQDRYYLGLPLDMAESAGPELVAGQETMPTGVFTVRDLVVGQTYRWTPGNTYGEGVTETLACGSLSTTVGQVFTAEATTATITMSVPDTFFLSDSLKRVLVGVNNALCHFDFQNAAWGGYDEGDLLTFKMLFTASYVGRRRLFVIDHVSYVRLWEEDYTDRLAEPYVEIVVNTQPQTGETLQVNGGITISADVLSDTNYLSNRWGTMTVTLAASNLWGLFGATGYSPDTLGPWTAPDTRRQQMFNTTAGIVRTGVRFYSTTGTAVTVVTTGTWATVTHVIEQQIQVQFESRGYVVGEGNEIRPIKVTVDVDTWNPSYSMDLVHEGVNEEAEIAPVTTRSRTVYTKPWDRPAWTPTNINDDFPEPYRGDYSIQPTSPTFEFNEGEGVRGDLHQSARHTVRSGRRSRACRLRLACTQGRVRLKQVLIEAFPKTPQHGVRI